MSGYAASDGLGDQRPRRSAQGDDAGAALRKLARVELALDPVDDGAEFRARWRQASFAIAVTITTVTAAAGVGIWRNRSSKSSPFMSGMEMSRSTTDGTVAVTKLSAAAPAEARRHVRTEEADEPLHQVAGVHVVVDHQHQRHRDLRPVVP